MRHVVLGLVLFLAGCPWVGSKVYEERVEDVDGDGEPSNRFDGDDCQDDNGLLVRCDADGDGFLTTQAGGDDCDDGDASVNPAAEERCDLVDNDCDGAIDNDDTNVVSTNAFYLDGDGDGDGDPDTVLACQEYLDPNNPATGIHVSNDRDCDDDDDQVNRSADELCDGFDNNCDGVIDDVGLWFADADGDGFGNPATQVSGSCDLSLATGLAATGGDCDDNDADVNPGADEVHYDDVDQNCNGDLDNWDADLDGHVPSLYWPDAEAANQAQPVGQQWDIVSGDCDDDNSDRFFGNPEVCDGVDNDCDGAIDTQDLANAAPTDELALRAQVQTLYEDLDGDGHFGVEVELCPADVDPLIHSFTQDDCFEGQGEPGFGSVDPATVYVGAPERCDGVDNDCNTRSDWAYTAFSGATQFYLDGDFDGFGQDAVWACAAMPSIGIISTPGDCNDGDENTFPGAPETCGDAIRQDCSTASIWDCDGDGQEGDYFGNGSGQDCDDNRDTVYETSEPLFEKCDGLDNDCDGLVDSADTDNLDTTLLPFWYVDQDLDGWGGDSQPGVQQCDAPSTFHVIVNGDCDDLDADISPATPWYQDADGDGYGRTSSATVSGCTPPPVTGAYTWVRAAGDCNDTDPAYSPNTRWFPDDDGDFVGDPAGADRFCTPPPGESWVLESAGIDCDDADPLVQFATTWYADVDNDGSGDANDTVQACAQPIILGVRYVADDNDCNDADPTQNPQRQELCNAIDDDCDGLVDDLDPNLVATPGGPRGYQDLDGDGFGVTSVAKDFCFAVAPGWAAASGDCDDTAAAVNPGASEVCGDGIDNDCDGAEQTPTWYADGDLDGFGAGPAVLTDCTPPAPTGYATRTGDCNDSQALTFPGAPERDTCDAIDDNCDGTAEPRLTWYFDRDDDGYGDPATAVQACAPPSQPPMVGWVGAWILQGGDCDDDPLTGTNITFGRLWYVDGDGDGLGSSSSSLFDCPQFDTGGQEIDVWLRTDVNGNGLFDPGDEQLSVYPGDCNDGRDDIGPARTYSVDEDGDTWGATGKPRVVTCPDANGLPPAGLVERSGDCVDSEDDRNTPGSTVPLDEINPDFAEIIGDGEDNDCDGLIDQTGDGITWYEDDDGDGLGGNPLGAYQPGAVTNSADCDDTNPNITSGYFVYVDADNDAFGAGSPQFQSQCTIPAGFATTGGDCNDANNLINPGRAEICDGIDQNCNALIDEALATNTAYVDLDGDLYGDAAQPVSYCGALPAGLVADSTDCNDLNAAVNPGQPEICDGFDNDCNAGTTEVVTSWHADADGDGFGSAVVTVDACTAPGASWLVDGTDCNDADAAVNPTAAEVCDGKDNDCNATTVETVPTWYLDSDDDGFGNPFAGITACVAPGAAWLSDSSDCDDRFASAYPGAAELCNGLDDNCDNLVPLPELDGDGDGYSTCEGDPDDSDPQIRPPGSGADLPWYLDADGDGYGAGAPVVQSTSPGPQYTLIQGDCNDSSAQASPSIPYELCDGIDNNCDGAYLDDGGTPVFDVTNPFRSTLLVDGAGGFSNYGAYIADIDADSTFSVRDTIETCDFRPGATAFVDPSVATVPIIVATDQDPMLLTYTDCGASNGTMYVYDYDGDTFVGQPQGFYDLYLDCGTGPVPFGFFPYSAPNEDCDPFEPNRWRILPAGEYPDLDGDGNFSSVTAPGQCGGMTVASAGNDCNDLDFDFDPERSNSPLSIASTAELQGALTACREAEMFLDTSVALSFGGLQTKVGANLRLVGSSNNDCNDFGTTSCVNGNLSLGDFTNIEIENLGIGGRIHEDAGTQSTVRLLNGTSVRGQISLLNSGYVEAYGVSAYSAGPASFQLDNGSGFFDFVTFAFGNTGIQATSSPVTVVNSTFDSLSTGILSDSAVNVSGTNFFNNTTGIRVSGFASALVDGSFYDNPTPLEIRQQAHVRCEFCNFNDSGVGPTHIVLNDETFAPGARLELIDSSLFTFASGGPPLIETTGNDTSVLIERFQVNNLNQSMLKYSGQAEVIDVSFSGGGAAPVVIEGGNGAGTSSLFVDGLQVGNHFGNIVAIQGNATLNDITSDTADRLLYAENGFVTLTDSSLVNTFAFSGPVIEVSTGGNVTVEGFDYAGFGASSPLFSVFQGTLDVRDVVATSSGGIVALESTATFEDVELYNILGSPQVLFADSSTLDVTRGRFTTGGTPAELIYGGDTFFASNISLTNSIIFANGTLNPPVRLYTTSLDLVNTSLHVGPPDGLPMFELNGGSYLVTNGALLSESGVSTVECLIDATFGNPSQVFLFDTWVDNTSQLTVSGGCNMSGQFAGIEDQVDTSGDPSWNFSTYKPTNVFIRTRYGELAP
ncbi:MAG: putative metal-binding motif-containing protein [Alphaproteobacteria bacterium]|nr:putative metal-binding motif-containing protein [Alphaproteobacteria bacterium]